MRSVSGSSHHGCARCWIWPRSGLKGSIHPSPSTIPWPPRRSSRRIYAPTNRARSKWIRQRYQEKRSGSRANLTRRTRSLSQSTWIVISSTSSEYWVQNNYEEHIMNETVQKIFQGIVDGQQDIVVAGVEAALESGVPAGTILNEGMLAAMSEIGRQFEEGECYVPEMMVSARAMKAGLAKLKPNLTQTDTPAVGLVAIGTVKGDLHDMGKNLVGMMLEGAGFTVRDLGVDVSPEAFVAAADEVDVIGLSALLTTTMGHMQNTLDALQAAGKRSKVKVIVGGAPVTEDFARRIGADGYAPDASRAVALAKSLISPSA